MYVDPPISRQKTVAKKKPDGTHEVSHTIEHDTTIRALRNAHPSGRRGGQNQSSNRAETFKAIGDMAKGMFRAPSSHRSNAGKPGHHFVDSGRLDTSQVVDRRQFDPTSTIYNNYNDRMDPTAERPAPRFRHTSAMDYPDANVLDAGSTPTFDIAQVDPRLERPAPAYRHLSAMDFPINPDGSMPAYAGSQLPSDSPYYTPYDPAIDNPDPATLLDAAAGRDIEHYMNRLRGSRRAREAAYRRGR